MKIILIAEDAIRLEPVHGPMTIEAMSPEQQYSPFHMLASSLAFCTFSVMYAWAQHAKLAVDDLAIEVRWQFAEDPHRVGAMQLTFDWPSLPEKRILGARRAAELCTIHATLHHPPAVTIASAQEAAGAASEIQSSAQAVPASAAADGAGA